jgi:hypothetical protein
MQKSFAVLLSGDVNCQIYPVGLLRVRGWIFVHVLLCTCSLHLSTTILLDNIILRDSPTPRGFTREPESRPKQ